MTYDIATRKFEEYEVLLPDAIPDARNSLAMVTNGNSVWVFGGGNSDGPKKDLHILDLKERKFN